MPARGRRRYPGARRARAQRIKGTRTSQGSRRSRSLYYNGRARRSTTTSTTSPGFQNPFGVVKRAREGR